MKILEIDNLNKFYGSNHALCDLSFSFERGIYGLLGPNGAGKSTLMNILTQNLKASSGIVKYEGQDIIKLDGQYRKVLGYMPQQQKLYPDFTLNRFLHYMAALKGMSGNDVESRIKNVIAEVNLEDVSDKKLGGFSGGMKQRALLAQAILSDPEILILDEPTAGLDPKERIRIRNLVSKIAINKMVLLATHVVSDIEMIADNVLLLGKGKLISYGTPAEVCKKINGTVFEKIVSEDKIEEESAGLLITEIKREYDNVRIRFVSKNGSEKGTPVLPGLEDVYLYHFGD